MVDDTQETSSDGSGFRITLIRVIIVQVIALGLLLWLQMRFGR
jgi:hypothetical protein